MRKYAPLFLGLLIYSSLVFSASGQDKEKWQELKSGHFIVYFTRKEDFARDVLNKSELYYSRIASDLNYPRYSEFWTWDNRVRIYIYPDIDSYLKATGQPQWSHGMADYAKKQIISYAWSSGFLESLLPHEMAHLIFRDFVGFKGEVPLWLDEGVAQWAETSKRSRAKHMARALLEQGSILSLEDMMKLDVRNLKEKEKVYPRSSKAKDAKPGVLFVSAQSLVGIYYIQAVSLVGFMIEKYGSDGFSVFCRQLRDGKSLDSALTFAYPVHIRGLKELEEKWLEYISSEENR